MSGLAYAPEARMLVPAGDPATAWTVILDPSAVADARTELSINSGAIAISQDGIDWGQAAIDAYEAELQKWGSTVVDFRVPNRMVTINLLVGADNSGESGFIDAAMQLRQKVALFQREGGWIQRGFDVPMYADIVSAALTFADQYGETAFLESNVVLTLECLPDFYGDEIELDVISCTGYCAAVLQLAGEQAVIDGDHPGRCRIIITAQSGDHPSHHGVIAAFRSRHYDSAATAALVFEGEALTALGSSSAASQSGASGGQVMRSGSLSTSVWTGVCSTKLSGGAYMTHQGSYRIWGRTFPSAAGVQVRLAWSIGSLLTVVPNDPVTLNAGTGLVDFGEVRLDKPPVGTYGWVGNFQALAATTGDTVGIDQIYVVPLDESALKVETPTGSVAVVPDGGSAELRTDGTYWLDSNGGVGILTPEGDLPRIPPSGLEGRAVELFVKDVRADLASISDSDLDPFTVQVKYRPSYVFRP